MATILASRPFGGLALSLSFGDDQIVVEVRGEVDPLTAPQLRRLLDSVIHPDRADIVLDLAELEFIGAAGLGVIAAVASQLRLIGGELILRSPPLMTRKILDITDVGRLVKIELAAPASSAGLGPEQRPGDQSSLVTVRADEVVKLTRLAAVPATDAVIDAALRLVVALAKTTIDGADGVSVSLDRRGRLKTVAASDETIAQMDRDQYATAEGPCVAAATEGKWFHVETLAAEERWPNFIDRARRDGIGSILSTPLMVGAQSVGALNMYSNAEAAFGAPQQDLAALFATQASGILADAGIDVTAEGFAQRLQSALYAREAIAHAQGVLMERTGLSADGASAILRRSARNTEVSVRDQAVQVVASTRREGTPAPDERKP